MKHESGRIDVSENTNDKEKKNATSQEHPPRERRNVLSMHALRRKSQEASALDEHHIFGGPNRGHSEENGLKVWLCLDHHTMGPLAVHRCPDTMRLMHRIGQQEFEKTHSRQQFIEIFGKSYL